MRQESYSSTYFWVQKPSYGNQDIAHYLISQISWTYRNVKKKKKKKTFSVESSKNPIKSNGKFHKNRTNSCALPK